MKTKFSCCLMVLVLSWVCNSHSQIPPGHCLYFDGRNARVTVPHDAALNAYPMTLTAWVQVEVAGLQRLILLRRLAAEGGYSIAVTNGIVSATYMKTNGPAAVSTGLLQAFGAGIADGSWHHLAFVVGFQPALYVDGVWRASGFWSGQPGACQISTNLAIGGESHPQWRSGALIDEVTLWNRELNQAEIQRLMTTPANAPTNGLIASWRLNEGSGTTTTNSAGAAHVGTLADGPLWVAFGPPEVATTGSAFNEGGTAALFGSVNARALPTRAWFEWGTDLSYGNLSSVLDAKSRHVPIPAMVNISPLPFGIVHFRAVASNSLGRAYGEDRTFDTTLRTVNTLMDSVPGSLRHVIANALPETTIRFSVTGTIALTSGELLIDRNLKIEGPGAGLLAVSGGLTSRVFNVASEVTARISGLSIKDGRTPDGRDGNSNQVALASFSGGGIYNAGTLFMEGCVITNNATGRGGNGADSPTYAGGWGAGSGGGGGIYNSGTLSLNACTVIHNATGNGGRGGDGRSCGLLDPECNPGPGGAGGDSGAGAGIYSFRTMEIRASTIGSNTVGRGGTGGYGGTRWPVSAAPNGTSGRGGGGGGIANFGPLLLENCTLVGNRAGQGGYLVTGELGGAGGSGGGLVNGSFASLILRHCTVTGNAPGTGGTDGRGGGISTPSDRPYITLGQTIIARNASLQSVNLTDDVAGHCASLGHNLIGNGNGSAGLADGVRADRVGTLAAPIDPLLGPLAPNQGTTWTQSLLPGSPAIDAGLRFGVPLTDQRGMRRVVCCASDIGAFEVQECHVCVQAVITSLTLVSNQTWWLQGNGDPDFNYTVQVSTNLQLWSDLTNVMTDSIGLFECGDPEGKPTPPRFYRLSNP